MLLDLQEMDFGLICKKQLLDLHLILIFSHQVRDLENSMETLLIQMEGMVFKFFILIYHVHIPANLLGAHHPTPKITLLNKIPLL